MWGVDLVEEAPRARHRQPIWHLGNATRIRVLMLCPRLCMPALARPNGALPCPYMTEERKLLSHMYARMCTPQKAKMFMGLMQTIGRRMLVSAMLSMSCWPWAVEDASEGVQIKALTPSA